MQTGGAAMGQDWSALPLDVLLISMSSMEVPDIVRSGAVCTTWRSAYAAFRALGLATPRQPPCLLYYARDSPGSGTTATLYSPFNNTSFRVPMEGHRGGFLGSAHGWLFTTDEAANPYLLNPLTGAWAALPPITTLERVRSSSCADDGGVVYNVDFRRRLSESEPEMTQVTARRVRDWMYHRVAVSASPLAAARSGAACVVLLIHMPYEELSFARPGDERWTSLSNICPHGRGYYSSAVYSDKDGLFYVELVASPLKWTSDLTCRKIRSSEFCYWDLTSPQGLLLLLGFDMPQDSKLRILSPWSIESGHLICSIQA